MCMWINSVLGTCSFLHSEKCYFIFAIFYWVIFTGGVLFILLAWPGSRLLYGDFGLEVAF